MTTTTIKSWLGQVTTGIGALIGAPVAIALLTSQITLDQAIPGIIAAVIGLIWPENPQFAASAQAVASDAEVLIPQLLTAYRTGLQHGAHAAVPPPAPTAAPILTPAPIAAAPPMAPATPQAA
jgi:hypothetical protein